jgi:hypothetical protein
MVKKGREILEDKESDARREERGEESERPNAGKLILDATCAPADIKYPTDLDLLNQARQGTEKILDCLYREVKEKLYHFSKFLTDIELLKSKTIPSNTRSCYWIENLKDGKVYFLSYQGS